jgi:hypothetical protein
MYGCETWSVTIRNLENRLLKRMFVPEKEQLDSLIYIFNEVIGK